MWRDEQRNQYVELSPMAMVMMLHLTSEHRLNLLSLHYVLLLRLLPNDDENRHLMLPPSMVELSLNDYTYRTKDLLDPFISQFCVNFLKCLMKKNH
jgi:hypothetical protein